MIVCASYEVVEMIEEYRNFFTASEFVGSCLLAVAEEVCPDILFFEDVSISARTCVRHM
jgi:hypothetical protein